MNIKYRIHISQHQKLFFTFDIGVLNTEKALALVLGKFREDEGFERSVLIVKGEKRILESSDAGIKVLACLPEFEEVTTYAGN